MHSRPVDVNSVGSLSGGDACGAEQHQNHGKGFEVKFHGVLLCLVRCRWRARCTHKDAHQPDNRPDAEDAVKVGDHGSSPTQGDTEGDTAHNRSALDNYVLVPRTGRDVVPTHRKLFKYTTSSGLPKMSGGSSRCFDRVVIRTS